MKSVALVIATVGLCLNANLAIADRDSGTLICSASVVSQSKEIFIPSVESTDLYSVEFLENGKVEMSGRTYEGGVIRETIKTTDPNGTITAESIEINLASMEYKKTWIFGRSTKNSGSSMHIFEGNCEFEASDLIVE